MLGVDPNLFLKPTKGLSSGLVWQPRPFGVKFDQDLWQYLIQVREDVRGLLLDLSLGQEFGGFLVRGQLSFPFLGRARLFFLFRGPFPSFHNKHGNLVHSGQGGRLAGTGLVRRDAPAPVGRDAPADPEICEAVAEGPHGAETRCWTVLVATCHGQMRHRAEYERLARAEPDDVIEEPLVVTAGRPVGVLGGRVGTGKVVLQGGEPRRRQNLWTKVVSDRSMSLGLRVGSCVDIMTRVPVCRCWRMIDVRSSVSLLASPVWVRNCSSCQFQSSWSLPLGMNNLPCEPRPSPRPCRSGSAPP